MPDDVRKAIPAERPRLVDFLLIAETLVIDVGLRLWVGAIDVGLVGASAGRVVFAELPGATGDQALTLLASLSEARIVPEPWVTRVTNVESHWRVLVNDRHLVESNTNTARMAAARDVLRAWGTTQLDELEPERPKGRALRIAIDLLDWGAIGAYLHGDVERAEQLLERRSCVGAADSGCRANLESLRLRRLDAEFESHLVRGDE